MKKLLLLLILIFSSSVVFGECVYYADMKAFESCLIYNKGQDAYERGDYEESVRYYKEYIGITGITMPNWSSAVKNLVLSLNQLIRVNYDKKNWDMVLIYANQALTYDTKNVYALELLGSAYWMKGDLANAQAWYQIAYNTATNSEDIKRLSSLIEEVKNEAQIIYAKKNAPTNDSFSYLQYYLKDFNITEAWGKVKNSNEVIVAVIDDGININHPDLKGKIWVNPKAEYGTSKVIDFVGDKIGDNMPTGQHGTMIAGIIGANTDNNEGIAGIAKNVKMMPLRVFGFDGNALDDNIIRAINYAIDNGASIINLSLGGSQFAPYTDKYDNVIKRAYDKGIIVVIAAGNGDVLSKTQSGIDLSINPISPVCNNKGNVEYSLGVAALNVSGYRTSWTNYNACISFYAPGELIISTSIPVFNSEFGTNYNMGDGTSYAAPMIAGIIALGYNQFGWVSPKLVRESLMESLTKNSVGNQVVDASKYLDALKKRLPTIQKEQKTRSQAVDTTSDADILAGVGIITKKNTISEYRLENNVLRQEVIGMAIKLAGITLPTEYTCKNIFRDVSAAKPNNWVCRSVEIGVERGIVSGANKNFNPESNITRAEALAILMNAAGIKTQESPISKFADVTVPWQINIVNTAFSYSFIDMATNFYPNKNATRGEIFNMAKRILKSKS